MVSGIVYSEADSYRSQELSAAKKGLTDEILSVSRVQVGTSTSPRKAYANEPGASLLKSIYAQFEKLGQQVTAIREEGVALREEVTVLRPLKEKVAALEGEGVTLREKVAVLEGEGVILRGEGVILREEVTILRPLKESAVAIRKRFFAFYLREKESGRAGKDPVIEEGNKVAHDGDVITDICLIKNCLMDYKKEFNTLYGLDWESARELSGMQIYFYPSPLPTALSNIIPLVHHHIIEVMNLRATMLSNNEAAWTQELEAEFRQLIHWTCHATQEDLQVFAGDYIGKTWGKWLDLYLKGKR